MEAPAAKSDIPTLRPTPDGAVEIIDQTALPHACRIVRLACLNDAVRAIRDMQIRGAPLIGVAAAYGLALALKEKDDDEALASAIAELAATRPTAVNLPWVLARMRSRLAPFPAGSRATAAWREAAAIAGEEADRCRHIITLSMMTCVKSGMGVSLFGIQVCII
jgi:methylthioribose-1-phosphate isomerase